jgi:hypothetical protein
MMAGYVVKTALHLLLGGSMLYWKWRWDREARDRNELISEEERKRKAEEIGMVSAISAINGSGVTEYFFSPMPQNGVSSVPVLRRYCVRADRDQTDNPYFRYAL